MAVPATLYAEGAMLSCKPRPLQLQSHKPSFFLATVLLTDRLSGGLYSHTRSELPRTQGLHWCVHVMSFKCSLLI